MRPTSKAGKGRMKLRPLGFFPEREVETAAQTSLRELVRERPGQDEAAIVNYLRRGTIFIYSPGVVFDVLDGSGPIGSGSIRTDGVWAWPDDLPHYVERYHVALPNEFVEHARALGWTPPELTDADLRLLTLMEP